MPACCGHYLERTAFVSPGSRLPGLLFVRDKVPQPDLDVFASTSNCVDVQPVQGGSDVGYGVG
jgi:hypothetical protein